MAWDKILWEYGPWPLMGLGAVGLIFKVFLPMLDKRDAVIAKAAEVQREQAQMLTTSLREQVEIAQEERKECQAAAKTIQEEFLRSLKELEAGRKEEVRSFLDTLRHLERKS